MELTSNHIDEAVACRFPDCADEAGNPSIAEPEQDGDLHYHHCPNCGNDFGWRHQPAQTVAANPAGACAVGIPEDLRRRASAGMENALRQQPPLLQLRRRDASAS